MSNTNFNAMTPSGS